MRFTSNSTNLGVALLAGMFCAATPSTGQEVVSTDAATNHAKTTLRSRAVNVRPSARYRLSEPRLVELKPLAEGEAIPAATARGNRVAGKSRKIGWDSLPDAASETLPDGRRVWRMAFRSPGAAGVRVHFTNFDAGAGSVWVYGKNSASESQVAYSGKGLFADGDFWSELVLGDTAIVEYQSGASGETAGRPPFRIEEVSHILPKLFAPPSDALVGLPSHARAADRLKSSLADGLPDPASCEFDVACASDQWRMMSHAVALYVLQEDDFLIFCTGTLMNNIQKSFRPYFLTANHCVSDAATAKTALVFWDYQSLFCNGKVPDPGSLPQQNGATLLTTAAIENGDYTLLLLQGDAPDDAIYSGWTTADLDMGSFVAAIHHPVASFKRFSSGNRVLDRATKVTDDEGNVMGVAPADLYYRVNWAVGLTEPGSSGSALFNNSGQLIGVLSHGNSDCGSVGTDGYGRFQNFFPSLRQYLVDDKIQ